jgi:glycosyltransferase involved in cell wall biosynthesis
MAKIKIVYILNGLAAAGVEKVTIDVCNHLNKERFEVCIITLSTQFQTLKNTIHADVSLQTLDFDYVANENPLRLYRQYRKLKKILFEIKPDIVHVSLYAARLFMVSSVVKNFSPAILFVKTEHFIHHQLLPPTFKTGLSLWLEKKAFSQNQSYITTVARTLYPNMCHLFGKVVKKIVVIENGVDTQIYDRSSCKTQRERFGFRNEDIIFVQVARLVEIKDPRTLIKAWKTVIDYFRHQSLFLKLLFIGDGDERDYLENYIEENQLHNSVILTGNIDHVAEYLSISDVGVLASRGEGLCLSLIEKMLMQLPLIVSDIESNQILVENNVNGLLFPVENEEALAQSMIYMVENPEKRRKMGENGYKKAKQHFSLDRMIKNYEDFYDEILSARKTNG